MMEHEELAAAISCATVAMSAGSAVKDSEEASDGIATAAVAESSAPPQKPKWVPPSVRRRMEEEAARRAEEVAAGPTASSAASASEPAVETNVPQQLEEVPPAAAAAPATKQKWVPPSVKKRMEAEAAKAAAAAASGGYPENASSSPSAAVAASVEGSASVPGARVEQSKASATQPPCAVDSDGLRAAPEGLHAWLDELNLSEHLPAATQWCIEQGASFLDELVENAADLAEALDLNSEDRKRIIARARSGLEAVQKRKASEPLSDPGPSQRSSSTLGLTLRCHSTSPHEATHSILFTVKLKKKLENVVKKLPSRGNSGDLRSSGSSSKGPDDSPAEQSPMNRLMSIGVHGPCCEHIASIPVHDDKSLEFHPVEQKGNQGFKVLHRQQSISMAYGRGDRTSSTKPRPLRRMGTCGLDPESHRGRLVDEVGDDGVKSVNMDEGQTGTVYALESGGKRIAVFKPLSGENFKRKGLHSGQGAVREEAVYLVDRLCGSQAGVPVTSRASIDLSGGAKVEGSVQEYVSDVEGFIEDYGMPHDLEQARAFVCQNAAEALALLDMRVFNMDRHPGNLLVRGRGKPHALGAIDHGCCLPPWWCLSEAIFDAWCKWPQLRCTPSNYAQEIARQARSRLSEVCDNLSQLPLDTPSLVTLKICVRFVSIGVAELQLPIALLAVLMLRDEDTGFQELSWLESRVLRCAQGVGAPCEMEVNDRGDQEIVVPDGCELEEEAFLSSLESVFRAELPEACGQPPAATLSTMSFLSCNSENPPTTEYTELARSGSETSDPQVPATRW